MHLLLSFVLVPCEFLCLPAFWHITFSPFFVLIFIVPHIKLVNLSFFFHFYAGSILSISVNEINIYFKSKSFLCHGFLYLLMVVTSRDLGCISADTFLANEMLL